MKIFIQKKIPAIVANVFIIAALISCGSKWESGESPVYELNSQVLYNGSIYYNQSSCANCHGVDFSGNGPDAADLKVPNLAGELDASKTHLDYFKSLSAHSIHSNYQALTDRGRWALAHYMYSISKGVKKTADSDKVHSEAMALADNEIRKAYQKQRRWFMGAKPLGERPDSQSQDLQLDNMLGDLTLDKDVAVAVDLKNRNLVPQASRGSALYNNNCATCHGKNGEGSNASYVIGPTSMCKDRNRQCVTYLSVGALRLVNGAGVHANGGLNLPVFATFTDDDWQQIDNYLNEKKD